MGGRMDAGERERQWQGILCMTMLGLCFPFSPVEAALMISLSVNKLCRALAIQAILREVRKRRWRLAVKRAAWRLPQGLRSRTLTCAQASTCMHVRSSMLQVLELFQYKDFIGGYTGRQTFWSCTCRPAQVRSVGPRLRHG